MDLDPTTCWLLARLSETAPARLDGLADRVQVSPFAIEQARDMLLERRLIARCPSQESSFELTPNGHATLEQLTRTGEQRLSDLLEGWQPEENPELARLIANLARAFFIDTSALRGHIPAAAEATPQA